MVAFRAFRGSSVFIKKNKNRNYVKDSQTTMEKQGVFRMEKYTELEVLISVAKSGDQGAISALNTIMEQMDQFQSEE